MKKIFYINFFFLSFILISCGSTPKNTDKLKDEIINSDINEISEIKNNTETTNESDILSEKTNTLHEELESIQEPEIFDMPIEEIDESTIENQKENSEKTANEDSQLTSEPITEVEDIIPPKLETINLYDTLNNDEEIKEIQTLESSSELGFEDEKQVSEINVSEESFEQEFEQEEDDNLAVDFPTEEIIIPSREVTLNKSEYLDIKYPGTGWIYMGTTDNSSDVISNARRMLGTQDTKYSLLAKNSGTKILHFYRNDPLTQEIVDDYIQVTVTSQRGSAKTHIQAPDYVIPLVKPQSLNSIENSPKATEINNTVIQTTNTPNNDTQKKQSETPVSTTSSTKSNKATPKTSTIESDEDEVELLDSPKTVNEEINTTELLLQTKNLVEQNQLPQALEKINTFLDISTTNLDEALFIKAQILESQQISDIAQAIETYKQLTTIYPASKYWEQANKRIIYLNRFYFEGR